LAINGPDLLSGASVIAQVGLGVGSILAGRELLNDLLMKGTRVSWQGQITFALASLFLIVVVIFYFAAPPGAALVYNFFGQRAIHAGNASEAELYLESAARLDPDPHAASLLEVGCLYQTLGAPDRAQSVFERVLEADSRLLLARFHLAELYSDRGDYDKALQLLEDGLNLLDTARDEIAAGETDFLPGVETALDADRMEYLLKLARGRAYLESSAPEQAKGNLRDAEALYNQLAALIASSGGTRSAGVKPADRFDLSCGPGDDLGPYILSTQLNLHYNLARTYDALCDDDSTISAAIEEWRIVRNGQPSGSRQEAWRDDAVRRLSSGLTCREQYGLAEPAPGVAALPAR
ncbi:MAG: tetratricopeptide repeat protein, partial [Anaerolineae bacterium]|nr:tetratricopeptide repeat protein [Anaerolineae bacterium]